MRLTGPNETPRIKCRNCWPAIRPTCGAHCFGFRGRVLKLAVLFIGSVS
jgi:hypothetical protein